MEPEIKFNCVQCNFKCNEPSRWGKHLSTQKHITGIRKIRSDFAGPYKCDKCLYETKNIVIFKQHKLTEHGTKEEREKEFKFYCKCCDFGSFSKDIYKTHTDSEKHNKYINKI